MIRLRLRGAALAAIFAATPFVPAFAQDSAAVQETAGLQLELNALQPAEKGCRVTFLATNGLGVDIERAGFEVALFGADGAIDRLVALDFKALTPGKTKVLQFNIADLDCTGVSRVLVNDISACEGEGLTPARCLAALDTATRTDIAFGL